MTDWRKINITDGSDQQGRSSPALTAKRFNVDEQTFDSLLSMGREFASAITYYNLNNEPDGHWGDLFDADEAVIMAIIGSSDLPRIESDFLSIPAENQVGLANALYVLACRINLWFSRLNVSGNKQAELLAHKIFTLIDQKLATEIHHLEDFTRHLEQPTDDSGRFDFSVFHSVWDISGAGGNGQFVGPINQGSELPDQIYERLKESFYILLNAISYLKSVVDGLMQQSLKSQRHNPAIGLFMVFLKLYGKAQQKLNSFTTRHLDFYYDEILKARERDEAPENYYLLLETLAGTNQARIEKGTEFTAGKNSGLDEIVYCADESIVVTDARVRALATLFLQQDELISPQSELGFVTRIKADQPLLSEDDSENGGESLRSWSLFGAENYAEMQSSSVDATIGFCIASPLFLLEQGERRIDLAIELESQNKSNLKDLIKDVEEVENKASEENANKFKQSFSRLFTFSLLSFNDGLTNKQKIAVQQKAEALLSSELAEDIVALVNSNWNELFYKLFSDMFSIQLTTEQGWLSVSSYSILPYDNARQKTGLKISLKLGQGVPPVNNYQAAVHGGDFDTELPLIRCVINPQTHFYPYSMFKNMLIQGYRIDVDVKGVKNLIVHNQHGQLDPSKPFQPFGPMPGRNSYVVFGNYEIARKQLTELVINLDWGELPNASNGFEEHYRGYKTLINNESFGGRLTALSEYGWQPADASIVPKFCLFENEQNANRLTPHKRISVVDPYYANPLEASVTEQDFEYNLKVRRGFFRISMDGPDAAFGHAEYPQVLTEVLTRKSLRKKPQVLPNLPYTPILNGISLDYKASAMTNLSSSTKQSSPLLEKIIHLHPFGFETVYPAVSGQHCFMLPQYNAAGNLFIGLTATEISGPLSLFFHLSTTLEQHGESLDGHFEWSYLCSNQWKDLAKKNVLADTTQGFLCSGRITLDLPKDINNGNSIMPGNYFWLRVSSKQRLRAFYGVYSIKANAIKLTKKINKDSIASRYYDTDRNWKSIQTVTGIGSIKQGYKTAGGREKENTAAKTRRISERLRHKNRALLPWDYEHLVLEQFPEICKVKCFPNISTVENKIQPGRVLIVVVSDSHQGSGKSCSRAMATPILLKQIELHLAEMCSPFVTLEVRNPIYERVQVRCTVCFVDKVNEGENINQLNQHICDYISPWGNVGYKAKFGWSIRQQDIESYIHSLDYVEHVTNFSMLHITEDRSGSHSLFDTVGVGRRTEDMIEPLYPWSLVLPMENHFIETMQTPGFIEAEETGVNELAVGRTLIIGENNLRQRGVNEMVVGSSFIISGNN